MGVATMTQRMQQLTTWLLVLTFGWVAVKTAWLADDAYITLRTVDNWLAGFGPVWNVTERVQAYTHPLWLLLLTGVTALTHEYFYSTIAVSILVSLAAFYLVVGKLAVDWAGALLAGAVLLLSKAFVDYSTSGLENALTHLLLTLFLWRFFCRPLTLRTLFWLSLFAALGAVNRLDSMLLFAPPLLYAAATLRHDWRRTLGVLALGMTPLLLWESFSLVYYGFPLPNTYYAKLATGLPLAALVEQGFYYFLHSAGADPLTLAAILAGVTLPWLTRNWRQAAVAVGVVLYLLYILRIGGDFMAGRFFSAPLLVSAVILARQPLLTLPRWQIAGVLILTVALGFANPGQSPWLSRADYAVSAVDSKGIADERGHYYQRYGLLPANRENRLRATGAIAGTPDPALFDHCGIGMRGFLASPYTHIVDFCGLADALIARLPVIYDPAWRIGHPIRHIPDGYLGTLRTGQNQLADADLAQFYDQLRLVIRGPLLDPARWQAIWQINTGQIAPTRDLAAYIYPDRATKAWVDFDRTWPESAATAADPTQTLARGAIFGAQGVTIALGERHHAPWVDLDIDADSFDLIFLDGAVEVGRSTVRQTPLQLGDQRVAVAAAPTDAVARGYDGLVVAPQLAGSYHLARVALLDPAQWAAAPPHVADLLRLAYVAFYQQLGAGRAELLDAILAAAESAPPTEWQAIPPQFTVDLLKAPDPALQALVLSRATPNQMLVDDQDRPLLRYLGQRTEALPADADEPGIHARLHFEVLAPSSRDYTLWFHAQNQETGAEFMLYDWPLPVDATTWSTGMIAEVPVFIALEPGEYKLTAGLWTPETRRRLYADRDADVYWLDLGVARAVEPASAAAPPQTR
jgi:arabinofuranosyltransferase